MSDPQGSINHKNSTKQSTTNMEVVQQKVAIFFPLGHLASHETTQDLSSTLSSLLNDRSNKKTNQQKGKAKTIILGLSCLLFCFTTLTQSGTQKPSPGLSHTGSVIQYSRGGRFGYSNRLYVKVICLAKGWAI